MPCFFSLVQRSKASKEEQELLPPPPTTTIRGLKLGGAPDAAESGRLSNSAAIPPPRRRKKTSRQIKTPPPAADKSESDSKLLKFGPIYGDDIQANQNAKEQALEHILEGGECIEDYLDSIQRIETKAKQTYHPTVKLPRTSSEFERQMVMDGCFFLQLAFHILGAVDLLDQPTNHTYFGHGRDSSEWIPAMFFVGNQIPYVVIRALVKRSFFQKVLKKGIERRTWRRPPKDLLKLVLYLTVVEPELKRGNLISSIFPKLISREAVRPRLPEEPSDILHALHCLVVGPGNGPVYSEIKEFRDLEAGRDNDDDIKFPSAGELLKSGIRLRKAENGITNIRFRNLIFRAYLYVPPITINSHTEQMFASLTSYEQNLNESDRHVTAYLRFLRDLAQTYRDFEILQGKGIIQVEKEELKYSMVHMLNKFVTSHKSNYTLNFRHIRTDITDYGGPPWRLISFLLGLLTVVQTVFTILSYFWPPS